jgi:hypothetical protein
MTRRTAYILVWLLLASAFCWAESYGANSLSAAEYRAQLDRLFSASRQLDSSGSPLPQALQDVPQNWRVRTEQGEFEISAEGLHRDLSRYQSEKNLTNATAIRARIQALQRDIEGYEQPSPDVTTERKELNTILARPEFRDVSGPSWLDRLKEKLLTLLAGLLRRMFRSSAIPTIGKFFVYGFMGLAILALAYLAYRNIPWGTDFEAVTPKDLPVSAKEWALWLTEARSAAAQGNWRDAVHLAYWAGISFLERQGAWKPDRARTPREYLILLEKTNENRQALATLTQIFEFAWYAKQNADDGTFSEVLAALERLGCR